RRAPPSMAPKVSSRREDVVPVMMVLQYPRCLGNGAAVALTPGGRGCGRLVGRGRVAVRCDMALAMGRTERCAIGGGRQRGGGAGRAARAVGEGLALVGLDPVAVDRLLGLGRAHHLG